MTVRSSAIRDKGKEKEKIGRDSERKETERSRKEAGGKNVSEMERQGLKDEEIDRYE